MALPERDWIDTRQSMGSFDYPVDKVRLRKDKILVLPDNDEATANGVILTLDKEEQHAGEIASIGSGVIGVKVGERVYFSKHDGIVAIFNGTRYIMMHENDIKAVAVVI